MRDIKFRAWDKENKEWISDTDSFFNGMFFNRKIGSIGIDFWSTKFELMQYTGLKDKNGKEIYEGDILDNGDYMEVCFGFNNGENEGWYLKRISDNYEYTMHAFTTPWNVIGNIRENPELLKK